MNAIEVSGLSRAFGHLVAVDHLEFSVPRGEMFGIVGPDGAGKTTLMRILAGVLPPTGGDARVAGVSVAQHPEAVKPHIAYMAQRFGLYDDLTVAENIHFYADLYRVPKQARPARIERLYAFSNLGEFRDRLAGNLSGGMKQKLSLSCALVHQPPVLLLDEPTFGVDPISRRDLWLILHEMVADGMTVVVSTSYLDEAERCDRVALLHNGRIIALDTPRALQRSLPGTMLMVRTAEARRARNVLEEHAGAGRAALFGNSIHVMIPAGGDTDVPARLLAEAGIAVESIEVAAPSLEDVFISLTGPRP